MISSRKHGVTEAQNLHQKHLPPSFLSDCVEPAGKVPVSVCVLSAALLGSAGWAANHEADIPAQRQDAGGEELCSVLPFFPASL